MNNRNKHVELSAGDQLFHLANRIIGLIYLIVGVVVVLLITLIVARGYLTMNPIEGNTYQFELQSLTITLWDQLVGNIGKFIGVIAPIFVLLFGLGVLHKLGQDGVSPFNTDRLLNDLPSLLALIIIVTICLLPLSGITPPDALNNIALVVVGFYFGKRNSSNSAES